MSKILEWILVVLFLIGLFTVPIAMVWGWINSVKYSPPKTLCSILSFIGFACATASALVALASWVYGRAVGGFTFYDHRLLQIYWWGGLLSLAGVAFAIGGVWRRNPLRWHAPVCAIWMLLFWLAAITSE